MKVFVVLVNLTVVFALGCGGGGAGSTAPTVTLTASTTNILIGQSDTLSITATNASSCTLSGPTNSGSVPCNGSFSVFPNSTGTMIYMVTASRSGAAPATASVTITVSSIPSLTVTPAIAILPIGGTQQFTVSVSPPAANQTVTWTIQEGTTGGTVTSAGLYSAPAFSGTFHLIATSAADPSRSGMATISVGETTGAFSPNANMNRVAGVHTATLLNDGRVLMAGGSQGPTEDFEEAGQSDAELYDPATHSFVLTGRMISPRDWHTATLLQNGNVLVTGGFGVGLDQPPTLASAELFDPATGTFSGTKDMSTLRAAHTATLLPNGQVLLAGGGNEGGFGFPAFGAASASVELYDPAANSFIPAGAMGTPRYSHTATLLPNGKVLIAGGLTTFLLPSSFAFNALSTAELYDPLTGSFAPTGNMGTARGGHTATLLTSGKVLVTGGVISIASVSSSSCAGSPATMIASTAELYDPATGTFTPTGSMVEAREEHMATLLPDGNVLIAGGGTAIQGVLNTAEIYEPATGFFAETASMGTRRTAHTSTLLPDGTVLVAGGNSDGGRVDTLCAYSLGSAETFRALSK
ncbi:MAG TPA: Ig-like domain-containing protein [Terriglobales bacterium]|jgi:hypothetical protein|nr:Ig-like domain-containing protein [Terriglobales bacterium]